MFETFIPWYQFSKRLQPRETSFNRCPGRIVLGVEPIRSPSLQFLPVPSIDRNHGCDPATTVVLSNGLGVIGCIGHAFRRPCDRLSP